MSSEDNGHWIGPNIIFIKGTLSTSTIDCHSAWAGPNMYQLSNIARCNIQWCAPTRKNAFAWVGSDWKNFFFFSCSNAIHLKSCMVQNISLVLPGSLGGWSSLTVNGLQYLVVFVFLLLFCLRAYFQDQSHWIQPKKTVIVINHSSFEWHNNDFTIWDKHVLAMFASTTSLVCPMFCWILEAS